MDKKWSNPGGQKPHWPWIYCQASCRGEISCWQILIRIHFFPRSVDHFLGESIPERVKSEEDGTSKKVNISYKSNLINTRLRHCFPIHHGRLVNKDSWKSIARFLDLDKKSVQWFPAWVQSICFRWKKVSNVTAEANLVSSCQKHASGFRGAWNFLGEISNF